MSSGDEVWPGLDYAVAKDALDALHMQTQVVGKVKLALTRSAPEWQNVPLFLSARGLTTGLLHSGDTALELLFDLVHHRLEIFTSDGREEELELKPRPLREFTAELMAALGRLGVAVTLHPTTVEVPHPVRFDQFEGYATYDRGVVQRMFRILTQSATVLEAFRAGFWGKQSPVSFFWGTFDLAVERFNLVPVDPRPGMGIIDRVAMDTQQSAVGFWCGSEKYPRPAYYAYTFPQPVGIESASIQPKAAAWNSALGEFVLDYDAVRASPDPRAMLLEFAESTYAAGAKLAGWDRALLERQPPK